MTKILLGLLITSYSLSFWILNLNLFTVGFNIFEYLGYTLTHIETLILFLGIYLLKDIIFMPKNFKKIKSR